MLLIRVDLSFGGFARRMPISSPNNPRIPGSDDRSSGRNALPVRGLSHPRRPPLFALGQRRGRKITNSSFLIGCTKWLAQIHLSDAGDRKQIFTPGMVSAFARCRTLRNILCRPCGIVGAPSASSWYTRNFLWERELPAGRPELNCSP